MCDCGDSTCGFEDRDDENGGASEHHCRFFPSHCTHVPISTDGLLMGEMRARECVVAETHVVNMANPGDFHLPVSVCAIWRSSDRNVDDPIRVIAFGSDYRDAAEEASEFLQSNVEGEGRVSYHTCDHLAALKAAVQCLVQEDGELCGDGGPFTLKNYPTSDSILEAARNIAVGMADRNSREDDEPEDDIALLVGTFVYLYDHRNDPVSSQHWHDELRRSTYSLLFSALRITYDRKAHDFLENASDETRWVWARLECENERDSEP